MLIEKMQGLDYQFVIYELKEENTVIGSIEFIEDENFIENIYLDSKYRGRGHLRTIVNFLKKKYGKLYCLPLKQHVEKFKHLGFSLYKEDGEDSYYVL